ncbi:MAG: endonuclease/exonuclease/phosphatase family protein, partial [Sedimenticola sp.]
MAPQTHSNYTVAKSIRVRLATWNVRGIMSSAASLGYLLEHKDIDIAFITEHKLFEHSKTFMSSIDTNYKDITYCDNNYDMYSNVKCGKGGVSILYKTALEFSIRSMDEISDERIAGIEISDSLNTKLFAFSVYMPPANYANEFYMQYINTLQAICDSYTEHGTIIFLGDMNGEVTYPMSTLPQSFRDRTFTEFMQQNTMTSLVYSHDRIGPPFSFITMEKMLDHVIMYNNDLYLASEVEIIDDDIYHVSDHLPICININLPINHTQVKNLSAHVAWNKITEAQLHAYQQSLSSSLENLCFDDVDTIYGNIINAILIATQKTLPMSKYNRHSKPYWSKDVKLSHDAQRQARRLWISQGRPRARQHESFANYKNAKRTFINTQKRAIQQIELKFIEQLNATAECDNRLFWSLIKKKKGKCTQTCCQLDTKSGVSRDPSAIADGFSAYYKELYTPLREDRFDTTYNYVIEHEVEKLKITNSQL